MQNNHKVWLQGSCSLCFVFVFAFVFVFVFAFKFGDEPGLVWSRGVVLSGWSRASSHWAALCTSGEWRGISTWVSSTSTTHHTKVFHILEHILHELKPGCFVHIERRGILSSRVNLYFHPYQGYRLHILEYHLHERTPFRGGTIHLPSHWATPWKVSSRPRWDLVETWISFAWANPWIGLHPLLTVSNPMPWQDLVIQELDSWETMFWFCLNQSSCEVNFMKTISNFVPPQDPSYLSLLEENSIRGSLCEEAGTFLPQTQQRHRKQAEKISKTQTQRQTQTQTQTHSRGIASRRKRFQRHKHKHKHKHIAEASQAGGKDFTKLSISENNQVFVNIPRMMSTWVCDDDDVVDDGDEDDICTNVNDDEGGSRHHSPWHCQVALHYTLQ